MKTHIIMVLDESGSMGPRRADVIGGFNTFIHDQKGMADECSVTLIKFNTQRSTSFASRDLSAVQSMSEADYTPGGATALYDAIAEAVRQGDDEPADKVLCVIVTDGEENSSQETTKDQVTEIIKAREARSNWTFAYLGVDPGQWSKETGIHASNTRAYNPATYGADMANLSFNAMTLRASAQFSMKKGMANDSAAVSLGRKGGLKGGKARAESLSPEKRSEIAKKAANKRWFKE